jgi:hypothetical protein
MMKDLEKGGVGLAAYEPEPTPNDGTSMHDLVAEDLWNVGGASMPVLEAVCRDLGDRKQFGLDKYGTLLQTNNGRDALVDAYQETLDLLVYLKQACCENIILSEELAPTYFKCLEVSRTLRKLIGLRHGQNSTTQDNS